MKRTTASFITRLLPAALCAAPLLATAGEPVAEPVITAPAPASPWEFRITPYAWLTAIDGTTGPDRHTIDIDSSFSDIAKVLKMAGALQMEARTERWGFLVDGFYANLGDSGHTSGILRENVDLDFKQFLGEFDVLYRVCESPNHFVDVYAGVRYNYLELDLDISGRRNISRSADKDWADPIVGLRGQWNINDKWYLAGKGDIGGFGVSSDLTWDLQASVGYNFTPCVSAEIGYRYFDTDYDDGDFTYDIAQAGLLIGLNFKF